MQSCENLLRSSGEEKVAILRRHLLDKVPVSDLCEETGLRPTVFYRSHSSLVPTNPASEHICDGVTISLVGCFLSFLQAHPRANQADGAIADRGLDAAVTQNDGIARQILARIGPAHHAIAAHFAPMGKLAVNAKGKPKRPAPVVTNFGFTDLRCLVSLYRFRWSGGSQSCPVSGARERSCGHCEVRSVDPDT